MIERLHPPGALWRRWVGANALAETLGLGSTALLGLALATTAPPLLFALGMIAAGTLLEGVLVGALQWWVLRDPLPRLPARAWMGATTLGAGVAWTLGMIPSTLLAGAVDPGANAAVPSDLQMYLLAALMGLVLGPILGAPQWWVLRRHVARAVWWIPANALAWAAGMVIVFAGVGMVPEEEPGLAIVLLVLATLAVAGAVVGAIHGAVLVRLLPRNGRVRTRRDAPRGAGATVR